MRGYFNCRSLGVSGTLAVLLSVVAVAPALADSSIKVSAGLGSQVKPTLVGGAGLGGQALNTPKPRMY
jgi:hypothetical protein